MHIALGRKTRVRAIVAATLIALIAYAAQRVGTGVKARTRIVREAACTGNLSSISGLLQAYRLQEGHFPPAVVRDRHGTPMHSWRVLILKYAAGPWYAAYNFDEPWNGPTNRKLASSMPDFYACPNSTVADDSTTPNTSFLMIAGPDADRLTPITDETPGDSRQAARGSPLIVESAQHSVNWLEPRDVLGPEIVPSLDHDLVRILSSEDPNGPAVLFENGTIERVMRIKKSGTQ